MRLLRPPARSPPLVRGLACRLRQRAVRQSSECCPPPGCGTADRPDVLGLSCLGLVWRLWFYRSRALQLLTALVLLPLARPMTCCHSCSLDPPPDKNMALTKIDQPNFAARFIRTARALRIALPRRLVCKALRADIAWARTRRDNPHTIAHGREGHPTTHASPKNSFSRSRSGKGAPSGTTRSHLTSFVSGQFTRSAT